MDEWNDKATGGQDMLCSFGWGMLRECQGVLGSRIRSLGGYAEALARQEEFDAVISFSHFVPRLELEPESKFRLRVICGKLRHASQVFHALAMCRNSCCGRAVVRSFYCGGGVCVCVCALTYFCRVCIYRHTIAAYSLLYVYYSLIVYPCVHVSCVF